MGQFPYFIQYSVENGLSSSEILDIQRDEKGYIWFVSAFGLTRYDGYDFMEFTSSDGLPSISNIESFRSPAGNVWFTSYDAKLCYSKEGKIVSYPLNYQVSSILKNSPVLNIVWRPDSSIILKSRAIDHNIQVLKNGEIRIFDQGFFSNNPNAELFLLPSGNSLIWGLNPKISGHVEKDADHSSGGGFNEPNGISFFRVDNDFKSNLPSCETDYTINFKYCRKNINQWYVSFQNNLFTFSKGHLTLLYEFKNLVNEIFIDQDSNLWISLSHDGVYQFPKQQMNVPPLKFLEGNTVSATIQDHQGGYWFSTLENGCFYVPGFAFQVYSGVQDLSRDPVQVIKKFGNKLLVSTNTHKTFLVDPGISASISLASVCQIPVYELVTDILVHSDGSVWLLGTKVLRFTNMLKPDPPPFIHKPFAYSLREGIDKSTLVVCDEGVLQYTGDIFTGKKWDFATGVHPRVICTDSSGTVWIGTITGLYKAGDHPENCGQKHPILRQRITAIECTRSKLYIGTRSDGLLVKNQDNYQHFNIKSGLTSNTINALLPDGDNRLWVGTNKGLNLLIFGNDQEGQTQIRTYTIWEGLPANEVRNIQRLGRLIWLGTNKGIISFDPDKLTCNLFPPILNFEKIIINDSIHLKDKQLSFSHRQNTLTFFYTGISFSHPGKVIYRYKVIGMDTNWIKTPNRSIRLPDLRAGSYQLILQASVPGSPWSEPACIRNFSIRKSYSETLAFRLGTIFLTSVFLLLIFYLIMKEQKNRAKRHRELILSEIKALRSQMNPHFIFNSLNSIQYFMLERDQENANIYLSSFAKLMRRILENSKYNLVPLEEELETVRLYLSLEQLRFEKAFILEERIADDVDLRETSIPPMILQPFLENSIWHGLMPKNEQGRLLLEVQKNVNGYLSIIIEDDGVGRSYHAEVSTRRPGHQSTGMKNISERINLFNKVNRSDISLQILDLHDMKGNPSGTRVTILFPPFLHV